MKPTLVIMAAGMGSRYGGLKQVDAMGPSGESIMEYSIFDAIRAGFDKVVFIIRKDIEEPFKEKFFHKIEGKIATEIAYQDDFGVPEEVKALNNRQKPWGTGHAILCAHDKVSAPFAVINADDFYGPEAFKLLADFFADVKPDEGKYAMVGYELKNVLSDYGTVSRGVCKADDKGMLQEIVESKKIQRDNKGIADYDDNGNLKGHLPEEQLVSMNFFGMTPHIFPYMKEDFANFAKNNSSDPKAEYFIQSGITKVLHSGEATMRLLHTGSPWFGVTYKEDKPTVMASIRSLITDGTYPENLWT